MSIITGIRSTGIITCECGQHIEIEMPLFGTRHHRCPDCQKDHSVWTRTPGYEEIFDLFGFRLFLDWDGQLMVESETEVPEQVRKWLHQHQGVIRIRFENQRKKAVSVYVGGSMNGQTHSMYSAYRGFCVHEHIGRKHWETYRFQTDGDLRLFYVGRSTSQKNAKAGKYLQVES